MLRIFWDICCTKFLSITFPVLYYVWNMIMTCLKIKTITLQWQPLWGSLLVQGIYWYTHHKLQQLWNLYHFVPNTILYHILKVSGNLGSGTWFSRAVYNTAWKHLKKIINFLILGHRTSTLHLIVSKAWNLGNLPVYLPKLNILCLRDLFLTEIS